MYHQSARVGVISRRGLLIVELPLISGVDFWVSRNRNLRTGSGQEWSSPKQKLLCAVRVPGLS